jgi:hypothetical protein
MGDVYCRAKPDNKHHNSGFHGYALTFVEQKAGLMENYSIEGGCNR